MIRHYVDEENRRVIAVAEDCDMDAINKIVKRYPFISDAGMKVSLTNDSGRRNKKHKVTFAFGLEKALMPESFRAVATCDPTDEYDYEVGREIADKKLLAKIKQSEDKAIARWKAYMIQMLNHVDLTFDKKGKE